MREIKFRIWDGNIGKMYSFQRQFFIDNNGRLFFNADPYGIDMSGKLRIYRHPKENHFRIMQYTGLKDKNGKEIYEGDVVFVKRYSPGQTRGSFLELTLKDKYRAIVEWDKINPTFVLIEISNRDHVEYDFVCCDLIRLEVIGNIYENPELLEAV